MWGWGGGERCTGLAINRIIVRVINYSQNSIYLKLNLHSTCVPNFFINCTLNHPIIHTNK